MAIYMMKQKTFPRGKGARVTQAAAYRAGERIRDERTERTHSYLGRNDVVYKEVLVPSEFAGNAEIAWTQDRAALWNAVERTDRRNAQLGREVMVVLPEELSAERHTQLVRGFAQELADKYRCAVDTTIHLPRPQSDERNHHAHLLLTPREVTPKGLGPRTSLELSGTERRRIGLGSSKDELLWRRQRWAEVANEALASAGFSVRIDHRALRTIAPGREPELSLPLHIRKIELATGKPTRVGEELRRQHRERVEARAKGPDEFARVVTRQKEEARTAMMRRRALESDLTKKVPRSVLSARQRCRHTLAGVEIEQLDEMRHFSGSDSSFRQGGRYNPKSRSIPMWSASSSSVSRYSPSHRGTRSTSTLNTDSESRSPNKAIARAVSS